MQALKDSLLILSALALVGCNPPDVTPKPEPEPEPEPIVEPVGPCAPGGQGLTVGPTQQRSLLEQWGRPAPRALLRHEPDVEGRVGVLVSFKPGRFDERALSSVGLTPDTVLRSAGLLGLRVNDEERARLAAHPDVASVDVDHPIEVARLAPLPFAMPWLAQTGPTVPSEITYGLRMVQAPEIWDADEDGVLDDGAPAGEGITVCTLDSGVDRQHPEIIAMYAGGKDFIDNDSDPDDSSPLVKTDPNALAGGGHGTHVQGTIAARYGHGGSVFPGMSEGGVVGVAPKATMITGRVLDVEGAGSLSRVLQGVEWCVAEGANIINLSLGSSNKASNEQAVYTAAFDAGLLVVAAAGNNGDDRDLRNEPHYPAAFTGVMAVAAVDSNGLRASFSQTGTHISVAAPGVGVLSNSIVGAGTYSTLELPGGEQPESLAVTSAGVSSYTGAVVDCGLADSYESCGEAATCGGFVALISRGGNSFGEKVKYAVGQGAKAAIIINYDGADPAYDGPGNFTLGTTPATIPVLSIGRTAGDGMRANLLGQQATVALNATDYAYENGTSMATPHVAGVAALVWSAKPDLTNVQLRKLLECSAQWSSNSPPPVPPAPARNIGTGYGIVKAKDALDLLDAWETSGWPADGCG